MSSHASARAEIWLKARFGVSILARFSVVRHAASFGRGYLASSLATVVTSRSSALSPSHGYALCAPRPAASGRACSRPLESATTSSPLCSPMTTDSPVTPW